MSKKVIFVIFVLAVLLAACSTPEPGQRVVFKQGAQLCSHPLNPTDCTTIGAGAAAIVTPKNDGGYRNYWKEGSYVRVSREVTQNLVSSGSPERLVDYTQIGWVLIDEIEFK